MAAVWGVDEATIPGPGRPAIELLGVLGSEVRALLVMGSNPVVSAPDSGPLADRLRSLDLWSSTTSSSPRRPSWPTSSSRWRSGPRRKGR